jgi:hypothetical protein
MQRLDALGLPPTFPPFMLPAKGWGFLASTQKEMTREALLKLATDRGLNPELEPLPHIGADVYGLLLDVDGLLVPFMVRLMTTH